MNHRRPNGTYARTIIEVRDEWHRRSGQRLSRARIWQIIRVAERKLRAACAKSEVAG